MNHVSAASQGLASCHVCSKVSPVSVGHCPRCNTALHLRKPHSLERTWAYLMAAVILYIPANTMPIMTVHGIGGAEKNTILSGVIRFWEMKSYPVAVVIFTASVLIPLLKVIALVWLCLAAKGRTNTSPRSLSRLYHITELLGRWSMVDVFVVAILVCLVQLGALMTITPGPAALSFSAVVILTMFSAMSFDPRLIWDQHQRASSTTPDSPPPHE
jgi:paraquat-inducible protein A